MIPQKDQLFPIDSFHVLEYQGVSVLAWELARVERSRTSWGTDSIQDPAGLREIGKRFACQALLGGLWQSDGPPSVQLGMMKAFVVKGSLPVIEDQHCASCWRHQMDKTETTSLLGSEVFTVLWNGYVVMTWSLGTRGSLSIASLFILGSSTLLSVACGLLFLKSAFPKSNFWRNEAC